MTDLFHAIPDSGRVVADGRSPSARPITVLTTLPPEASSAFVKFRSVSVVIVGTPQHVNLLAVSRSDVGSIWDPPAEVPTEIRQLPRLLPAGWSHHATIPAVRYYRTEATQDDELPSHESSKGDQRYSASW